MNRIINVLTVFLIFIAVSLSGADQKWMTGAELEISQPGLIETILIPELHRSFNQNGEKNQLDLSLVGPDGNLRPFELFWRSSGDDEKMVLSADDVEMLEDKGLAWNAKLPAEYLFSAIHIEIEQGSYAGKVSIEGHAGGEWHKIAAALPLEGAKGQLDWKLDEKNYDRIRLIFNGYDVNFKDTPVFVKKVEVTGRKPGKSSETGEFPALCEPTAIENGVEIRVFLPGSGLRIETLDVSCSALFKGKWQLGKEKIVLGKRDFELFSQGENSAVAIEAGKLEIPVNSFWDSRVAIIRMTSEEFFGNVEEVKVRATLPRLIFNADISGKFLVKTGFGKAAGILERPVAGSIASSTQVLFNKAVNNPDWQAESLLKGFSIKGGPFQAEGYTWNTEFKINEPGFYQLECSEEVCLDRYRNSLRIVYQDTQIPYFMGREELRELKTGVEKEYDSSLNRTVYVIKLPEGSARLSSLQFRAKGVFERTLAFEKHVPGQISWQPWQKRRWINSGEKEAVFSLPMFDFPEDQYELRMIVEHGSNQQLEISSFKGLYSAQDLFFVAVEPGSYRLTGGNPSAGAPVYDLAIVQDQLLELSPMIIQHGPLEKEQIIQADPARAVDQGAPFNDSGYTWVASLSVQTGGLYQLRLNQQASLDNNRTGFRLVKNGLQIPYFWGKTSNELTNLPFSSEYDKKTNTTYCLVKLPVYSRHWKGLFFTSSGIFMRKVSAEIRKPGKLGWQTFSSHEWVSKTDGESRLSVAIDRLPEGETELRLVIPHGDNSSIEISMVQAEFQTQEMLFNAAESGEFLLYGGSSKARAPVYDLALIRNSLLKVEPLPVRLGEISSFSGSSDIQKHIETTFSETGWGLYLVLGLVTLLLIVLIIKLFPEEVKNNNDKENDKNN